MINPIFGPRICYAPESIGGSSGVGAAAAVVRPNLAYIEKLRGMPLAGPRPTEIRTIACLDDESDMVELSAFMLANTFKDNFGVSTTITCAGDYKTGLPPAKGITIITASSEDEVSIMPDLIVSASVDLTFTDFNLYPHIIGSQIVSSVREKGHNGYIIGLTGLLEKNKKDFMLAGTDAVIGKPFNAGEIFDRMFIK
ncbi:MAG TPA: hypothetical protein VMD02_02610 [Candidatus Omnitrophota bacterium]|nr:hypothetical protein [Candidatus Omnitrophota bacterium]